MAYQALYRKWRPDNFNDVKGQDHIVTTLKNQIKSDRIGHAYLFTGTRGTGKTSIAKIMAKAVNCEHPVDGNPCGECPTCKAIAAGTSMNVIEIDAASNNGVDNIREIRDEVQYSPTEGKYKVYIIDEVHMLSISAFNALLKTLEEPPAYVIFILATTEVAKIPITVLSRVQRYDFHRITIDTITDRLKELMEAEHINAEEKALRYVAKAGDGSMRDALSLLDQCIAFYLGKDLKYENVLDVLGAVDTDVFKKMLSIILKGDVAGCMNLIEEIVISGRDLVQFVTDFVWYLRNMLLIKTSPSLEAVEDVVELSRDNMNEIAEQSKDIDADTLMRYIRVLSELEADLKLASQKRIKLEVSLIKMMKPAMEKTNDVGELSARVSKLETELEEALTKIKNGVPRIAIRDEETSPTKEEAAPVEKRVYKAVPEDIKKIAASWNSIVSSIDNGLLRAMLENEHVTLADDGISLEIMVQSLSSYNDLSREERKAELVELIEEVTGGIKVNLLVTKIDDNDDFHRRYVDLKELVGIDIEIDDTEEMI